MGANRPGHLCTYNGLGELALWPSPNTYEPPIGYTNRAELILILERHESIGRERWVRALVGGKVGWIKVEYVNLEWIDPCEAEHEAG